MSTYESPYGAAGTTSIPGGSVYARAALMANQAYKQRLSDLNRQRQQTLITSGYKANIDPETGLLKNFGVDPTSKYGGYQILNRTQAQQGEQIYGQNIERGLGTGGLAAQNLSNARFGWGQQDADFARGVQDQFTGFDRNQMDWLFERDRALWEAEHGAALEAQQSGNYGYADGGDGGDGGGYPPWDPNADAPGGGGGTKAPLVAGAWGPKPTAAMKKIISGIKTVKPTGTVTKSSSPYATGQNKKPAPKPAPLLPQIKRPVGTRTARR